MAERKSRKKAVNEEKTDKTEVKQAEEEKDTADNISESEISEEESVEAECGNEVSDAEQSSTPSDDASVYLEMLRRERADFENYKKRNATLASQSFSNGVFDVVEKILPTLDNFDRALAGADEKDPLAVGIKMIQRQLTEAIESCGVSEIEALGKEFNPEFMEAVMQVEKEKGMKSGHVAEVLQKGYKMKDRLIRPAMVKVVK